MDFTLKVPQISRVPLAPGLQHGCALGPANQATARQQAIKLVEALCSLRALLGLFAEGGATFHCSLPPLKRQEAGRFAEHGEYHRDEQPSAHF